MDLARENLEWNRRESLRWFIGGVISRLVLMTEMGLLFLVMVIDFAGWGRMSGSTPVVGLVFITALLLQWVPPGFLAVALYIGTEPASKRWTVPGFWCALGGLFCGLAIFLGPGLFRGDIQHTVLGLAITLVLESWAGSLFCRAKWALDAKPEGANPEEIRERTDLLSGWQRALWIFRGTMLLQVVFLIAFSCLLLRWDYEIPTGIRNPPTLSLGLVLSAIFLMASAFWFVHFSPWIVVYCLRLRRAVPVSTSAAGSPASGEGMARPGGEGKKSGRDDRGLRIVPGLVLLSSMVIAAGLMAGVTWDSVFGPKLKGPVKDLKATVILPAWEAELPEGKTVIWCATFQEAWRRLGKDVNGEAVQLEGMPEVSAELGRWNPDEQVWQGAQMVAEAGTPTDGVYQRIAERMEKIDPKIQTPDGSVGGAGDVAVAYGFLLAGLDFKETYLDRVVDFPTSVPGKTKRVKAFGMPSGSSDNISKLRTQCVVLYEGRPGVEEPRGEFSRHTEFCLDLDANSTDLQVLVARVAKPKSLREGWETLMGKMEAYRKRLGPEKETISDADSVAIPSLRLDLTAEFLQEHPRIVNGKLAKHLIGEATQRIWFTLDKGGAKVKSIGQTSGVTALPKEFTCDRPFLIVMKNRKSSVPFLMVWVDNPEVLEAAGFWP